ncbi:hypothetical protein M413DRAFT_27747 [Hebeloma cylindrosporum]|uniref:Uncharacterized protein n=1 Tax=Hebeloma cylindrosporum TaxID=76867 RepID=A0A0C2YK17_HEBCY|nr:hypothetical protein M413DRAFT_27747 [Hebeloma cylindrosporum h7]
MLDEDVTRIPNYGIFKLIFYLTSLGRIFGALGQTWCGKYYKEEHWGKSRTPYGSFQRGEDPLGPLFAFQCVPRMQFYVEGDDCASSVSVLVDTLTTMTPLRHASPLPFPVASITLSMTLRLLPRRQPFTLTCSAELESDSSANEMLVTSSPLFYLPSPTSGSATSIDRKTGALMTRAMNGTFQAVFPIGFYTDFGGYLAGNLSILDEIRSQGFNTVHPVPPFDNMTAFNAILDRMEDLGLYLISYQDSESVSAQVKSLKHRKNLLLWYTADEPDGPGDPLTATRAAYDLIHELDGYHPVSIALNCADHFFEDYVSGADIILPDVYMIGNNVTFSTKYNTPCTKDFGCCGCDDCEGRFEDVSKRLDEARNRLRILGWDKTKFIWAVTQAFGGEEFWSRPPTGREWLVQVLLSINHGARGIMPWIDPTPIDIKQYASTLAKLLPDLVPYFFDGEGSFTHITHGTVDVGIWTSGPRALVLATNMDTHASTFPLPYGEIKRGILWLLREGVSLHSTSALAFEPLGSAILILSHSEEVLKTVTLEHDEL